jgi:hypothetical protein
MSDAILAIVSLAGIIAVAASGYRFIEHDDARLEQAVLDDYPALWGADAADEVMSR